MKNATTRHEENRSCSSGLAQDARRGIHGRSGGVGVGGRGSDGPVGRTLKGGPLPRPRWAGQARPGARVSRLQGHTEQGRKLPRSRAPASVELSRGGFIAGVLVPHRRCCCVAPRRSSASPCYSPGMCASVVLSSLALPFLLSLHFQASTDPTLSPPSARLCPCTTSRVSMAFHASGPFPFHRHREFLLLANMLEAFCVVRVHRTGV